MRIAAIYIYENSMPFIFGEDHSDFTINLGGEYLYKLGQVNGNTEILEKNENIHYIDNFWGTDVINISAIVGENGSGKTKILELIKNGCELVIEENKTSKIKWSNDDCHFFFHTPYLCENNASEDISNSFNLSKLSQMFRDSRFENMDFSGHWEYHNSERLKRIINFIENEEFKNSFDELGISIFNKVKIRFLRIKEDDWNTSRNFIPYFKELLKIKEEERKREEIELQRKHGIKNVEDIDKNNEYNIAIQKLRLRLTILETIILKIHSILERTGNKFLEEGFIEGNVFPIDPEFQKIKSTKEAFIWFINNAFFKLREIKYYLPKSEIENLINTILPFVEEDDEIDNWTILTVDFNNCKKIIDAYQSFLISFKDIFTYDEKVFMTFYPDKNLSTGEMSFYELFSSLYDANYRIKNDLDRDILNNKINYENYVLLLDESDLGFHPNWKKKIIRYFVEVIPKIFSPKKIQIILTSHDALTLSDVPNSNIAYLSKNSKNHLTEILDHSNPQRPGKSFAANITNLLSDSFFIKDGLIGDFAKQKIEETIKWIDKQKNTSKRDKNFQNELEHHKKIVSIIDEKIIKLKLSEMIAEVEGNNDFQKKMYDDEIAYLIKKRQNLN